MRTNIFNIIKVSLLAFSLSFGLSFVYAWTAPTATPPGANVAAPINVSSVDQTKAGDFCTTKGGTTKCLSTGGGATPPAGSQFVDTSANAQTKVGDFTVGGILSVVNATFSKIGIGAAVDPTVALNVAGTIKATGLQLSAGAGAGKVLTSDSLGNTSWATVAQAGAGGGGLPEEVFYFTPGTYSFLVPSWMTKVGVEVVGGGGGGGSAFTAGAGGTGGTSSFGSLISATGGAGGAVAGAASVSVSGVGSGGFLNNRFYTLPYGYGGSGGARAGLNNCGPRGNTACPTIYGGGGGNGGYSRGVVSVAPGQTIALNVGAGGAGGCYLGIYYCGTAGSSGILHISFMPAPALANTQTFASNGTFTVPAGVTSITVEVWGGGGAGGPGGASQNYTGYWTYTAGGGGASGGYAKSIFAVTPGATYPVAVGAGGAGSQAGFFVNGGQSGRVNTQGKSGATSSFGSGATLVSALGGSGGVSFDTYCGGGGCNGNISCTAGWTSSGGVATNGNFLNAGGTAGARCGIGTGGLGVDRNGRSFGVGGNGGPNGNTAINYAGGNGAVVVSW